MFVEGGNFVLNELEEVYPSFPQGSILNHTDSWISHSMDSSILDKISLHLHTNRPARFWVVSLLCASGIKMVAFLQNTELDSHVCVSHSVCAHV